jgi:DNA-binding phage protein
MSRLEQVKCNDDRPAKELRLCRIALEMRESGLSDDFASRMIKAGLQYEGIADLMELWAEAKSSDERDEIIVALEEESDELDPKTDPPVRKPKLNYEELGDVVNQIRAFKEELRKKVDKWGGIAKLARETGIPQPSLSRFFSSASMPRRTTLYKIANALDLSETEITPPFSR